MTTLQLKLLELQFMKLMVLELNTPVKGTVKYNKDAFIVIKNLDRNPTVPSQPNPELKAHHAKS